MADTPRRPALLSIRHWLWVVLMVWCLLNPGFANAVEPVVLDTEQAPFELVHHTEYFIEPGSEAHAFHDTLLLPEVVELSEAGEFAPVTTPVIGFGPQNAIIHLRIPWINPSASNRPECWHLIARREGLTRCRWLWMEWSYPLSRLQKHWIDWIGVAMTSTTTQK